MLRLRLLALVLCSQWVSSFVLHNRSRAPRHQPPCSMVKLQPSRYEDSDAASKGIVSSLTNLVNAILSRSEKTKTTSTRQSLPSPKSANELLSRIREDYTKNNYLWTGDLDLSAFEESCRFTDPTISFEGTEQFVTNLSNLRPLVDAMTNQQTSSKCRSDLLDIRLEKEYIQTRWNMVGQLTALPWKPRVDVIGRTKFWYNAGQEGTYRVYFYDEEWELPAWKALLQLVTPQPELES
jgi:hypothetical protein